MTKKNVIITIVILLTLTGGVVLWNQKNSKQDITKPKQQIAKETQEQKIAKGQVTQKEDDNQIQINGELTQEEKIDTSDWKTYRNEEYGFEIKYPKDWIYINEYEEEYAWYIEFTQKEKRYSYESAKPVYGAITLSVSKKNNPNLLSVEEFIERRKKYTNFRVKKIKINGLDAYYFMGYGEGVIISNIPSDKISRLSVESPIVSTSSAITKEVRPVLQTMINSIDLIVK